MLFVIVLYFMFIVNSLYSLFVYWTSFHCVQAREGCRGYNTDHFLPPSLLCSANSRPELCSVSTNQRAPARSRDCHRPMAKECWQISRAWSSCCSTRYVSVSQAIKYFEKCLLAEQSSANLTLQWLKSPQYLQITSKSALTKFSLITNSKFDTTLL